MPPRKRAASRTGLAGLWDDLTTAQAIVLATLAALAIGIATLMLAPGAPAAPAEPDAQAVRYMPNPVGGIWVLTPDDLYICTATADGAAPCYSMSSDAQPTYGELGLNSGD